MDLQKHCKTGRNDYIWDDDCSITLQVINQMVLVLVTYNGTEYYVSL